MKKLFIILILLLLFNCQDNIQTERLKVALDFESELIQQFLVAPDSIIRVQGKKGTKITFKIEDLEGILNGADIKDSLYINLIELTTKQALLKANAQTISNGKWLISGGAFKIEISNGGESLTLKKGKTISVQLPKTSKKNKMEIFYGDRGEDDNMNWEVANLDMEEEKYHSFYYYLMSEIDSVSSTIKNGVETYEEVYSIDSLGFISINEYKLKYPKADSIYVLNDTLSNLKSWKTYEDMLANKSQSQLMYNSFYSSIEISKLGWINIDKFAPEEPKATIKLKYSIKIDAIQTYIVDQKNNTILNVQNDEVEIPINRSFYIISFALKDKTFYAFKKSARFSKNATYSIGFKKVNETQLKSVFELN